MKSRSVAAGVGILLCIAAAWYWWPSSESASDQSAASKANGAAGPTNTDSSADPAANTTETTGSNSRLTPQLPTDAEAPLLIRGQVFPELHTGITAAIAGAAVYVDSETRDEVGITTDGDGRFSVTIEPRAFERLRIDAPGYIGAAFPIDQLRGRVAQKDGSSRFYLTPGFPVKGRVLADGRAVPDALVHCAKHGMDGTADISASVVTDEQGTFSVNCGDETALKIIATHSDYRRTVTDWLTRESTDKAPVTLELEKGTKLRGQVLTEDGTPAGRVRLDVSRPDAGPAAMHSWDENNVALQSYFYTKSDGTFELEPLVGTILLQVYSPDGARTKMEVVLEGEAERFVKLVLEGGNQIRGRVTLDGAPAAKVLVGWWCGPNGMGQGTQLSDDKGRFHLKQLTRDQGCAVAAIPPHENLFWSHPGARGGFVGTRVAAKFGDQNVQLALTGSLGGSVEIKFSGAYDGYRGRFLLTPLGDLASATPAREHRVYTSAEIVSIERVRPGKYRLECELDDGLNPAPLEVVVAPTGATRVNVAVPDGIVRGTMTGRVVDSDGKPLAGARVAYSTGRYVSYTESDAEGKFRFEFEAQTVEISISLEGFRDLTRKPPLGVGHTFMLGDLVMTRL